MAIAFSGNIFLSGAHGHRLPGTGFTLTYDETAGWKPENSEALQLFRKWAKNQTKPIEHLPAPTIPRSIQPTMDGLESEVVSTIVELAPILLADHQLDVHDDETPDNRSIVY